jgi:hypothetical protein
MTVTYANKEDILAIMKFFRPDFTVANISDDIQSMCFVDIISSLVRKRVTIPAADLYDLLKAAEICFYMEHSAMARETENAFGAIKEETIGKYTKKYENGMPMFFFARGSSTPFLELLPHESWRMRGYKYVTAYADIYATLYCPNVFGVIMQDDSARGNGAMNDVSNWDETEKRLY